MVSSIYKDINSRFITAPLKPFSDQYHGKYCHFSRLTIVFKFLYIYSCFVYKTINNNIYFIPSYPIVNRALASLLGVSLEIILTVLWKADANLSRLQIKLLIKELREEPVQPTNIFLRVLYQPADMYKRL